MAQHDNTLAKRRAYLDQLRRVLPPSPPWEAWLAQTGELPPDFDALPTRPDLPDLLENVSNPEDWRAHRETIKTRLVHWVLGKVPPPPENVQAEVLDERMEGGATVREVQLRFGPGQQARLRLELLIPEGDGIFPVFMTQHNHRPWALIALRRGYLGCVYAGSDSRDDTDSFLEAYPNHDCSRLTRQAWAASRCIDYLETVPRADRRQIVLTGHSRNGKQSLIAAAFDERIAAVISSSSGAGGALTARHFSEQHFGEGVELITRVFPDWFHPRWRFFVGREHKLPVDLHELVALVAPRPCLLSTALNDPVESTWGIQQTYLAVQRVYRLLGAGDALRILWRPGAHETCPTVIERYLDWCDMQFRRARYAFPERLIHPHDWNVWRGASGESILPANYPERAPGDALQVRSLSDWEVYCEDVRARVRSMLGEAPPVAANPGGDYGQEPAHIAALLGRDAPGDRIEKAQVVFGEYINGDVYMPAGLRESGRRAAAVLWLHPFSSSNGYVAGYHRGEQVYRALAQAGFAVFCFDQIGHGRRIEEVEDFYVRHPGWSVLGKMVRDARAALDVLAALPYVDASQIWGLGYGLGSMVGLHLGALDERLAGFASVCGPPPFRLDAPDRGTGGVRRWSHLHMLLPRLGFFVGQEARIPYDVDDLMACMAPRPLLVVSPHLDWEAPLADVTAAVEAARGIYALYGAAKNIEQCTPEAYNHLDPHMQAPVIDWLSARG